jgi:hypothetical protein
VTRCDYVNVCPNGSAAAGQGARGRRSRPHAASRTSCRRDAHQLVRGVPHLTVSAVALL